MNPQTLDLVKTSQRVTVKDVTGNSEFVCRMYELGIIPGTTIEVSFKAPWSGPLYLRLERFSIFMRKSFASQILCQV